jgi:imidazolonepropionase-like amidohydrolase
MLKAILVSAFVGFAALSCPAQVPAPAKKQDKGILIMNAVIHDGDGKRMDGAWLRADGGKITAMGIGAPGAEQKQSCEITDAAGSHLYPGFILMNNSLGLAEIEAVRATLDVQETGADNPNAHSLIAYNTDSYVIPTLRLNGVLMAQICPRGGRISGTSSVVQLDAWNWEDAVIRERDGMHLNWPSRTTGSGWWAEPGSGAEKNKEYAAQVTALELLFEEAAAYCGGKNNSMNPKLEAFRNVFAGKTRLYIHASQSVEIIHGLNLAEKFGISDVALVSGSAVTEVAELLALKKIPVVLNRIHDLPGQPEGPVFQASRVPQMLMKAGLTVALDYEGSMEIMGARNLGFVAGSTRAYGLGDEEALSLITRNPARILGIDKTCGTLSPGKDATFFLSKGNALEMKSQELTAAWIQGRKISLESKQTQLYEKFAKMLQNGR